MNQREIKFRAWNADDEQMYSVTSVDFVDGTCEVEGDDLGLSWRDENRNAQETILMQFTGLKDKNGKEIYEGDILAKPKFSQSVEVQWMDHDGAWWVRFHGADSYKNLSAFNEWDECVAEVIGNIYENPELQKEAV